VAERRWIEGEESVSATKLLVEQEKLSSLCHADTSRKDRYF
jgi:hypothetical protein